MHLIIKIKKHNLLTARVTRVSNDLIQNVFRIDFIDKEEKNKFLESVESFSVADRLLLEAHRNNVLFDRCLFFSPLLVTLFEVTN